MKYFDVIDEESTTENPYQVMEGEWFTIKRDGDKPGLHGCCDCGLMHRIEFKVDDGEVFMRVHRDDEATRIRRDSLHKERNA